MSQIILMLLMSSRPGEIWIQAVTAKERLL